MFGKIELANFDGVKYSAPQKACTAWDTAMAGLVGCTYQPLLYVGEQITKGRNYIFIAEKTTITATPFRNLAVVTINEFCGEYHIVDIEILI